MKRLTFGTFLACLAVCQLGPFAAAADWPTWRYDAARSAASPHDIADAPVLLWSRKLPPVRRAWPLEPDHRIDFDASYEPVVMGQLMFLASANDGSVAAYDTETGVEKWRFYTEGPVRCAPACWRGKVLVGSDDGYLYCLAAQTGTQVWKFRGAPPDRPDRRHLPELKAPDVPAPKSEWRLPAGMPQGRDKIILDDWGPIVPGGWKECANESSH